MKSAPIRFRTRLLQYPGAGAVVAYEALIANHKRKVVEHYLEAKTPAGRTARLEKISGSIKAGP